VYSTCLFCKAKLGSNETIEHFPVGSRLAFDEATGRLWVVCRRCSRWNLTPLEERWEAIDTCERVFRETRKRMTTQNIGLARLNDGLELIRIGSPLRAEFAAWRYGAQLSRRRRRHNVGTVAGAAMVTLQFAGAGVLWLPWAAYDLYLKNQTVHRVEDDQGSTHHIARKHAGALRLLPDAGGRPGWKVRTKHRSGKVEVTGDAALQLAGALLPLINRKGADSGQVTDAVAELERAGGPANFFVQSAAYMERYRDHGSFRAADYRITDAPVPIRLALEMAAHEDTEQRAMEGELYLLEHAWREAEEIAAIADRLLLPPAIEEFIARHRNSEGVSTDA